MQVFDGNVQSKKKKIETKLERYKWKKKQKKKVYKQLLMLSIKTKLLGTAVFTIKIEFRDLPNARRDLKLAFFLRVLSRKFFPLQHYCRELQEPPLQPEKDSVMF